MQAFYAKSLMPLKASLQAMPPVAFGMQRPAGTVGIGRHLRSQFTSDGPDLSDPSDAEESPHWHASHSPPLRMASIEQASFSSALNCLAPAVWLMTELRISFWNSAVLFSMFEALRVRR